MGEALVSKEQRKPQQLVVDPNALILQAQELAQVMENMRSLLATLTARKDSLIRARETIEAITEAKEPLLIPADPEGVVFYKAVPHESNKFLVHLGLDVYALLDKEAVIEKIKKKESELDKEIKIVSERLEEARRQYEAIQSILQQLAVAAQSRQEGLERKAK